MVTSQKERKIDRFFLLSFFLDFWSITWLSFFLGFWRPNLITGLSGWPPSLGNFVFLPLSTTDHPGHEEYGTHTNQDTRTDLTKAIAKIDAGVSTRDLIQEMPGTVNGAYRMSTEYKQQTILITARQRILATYENVQWKPFQQAMFLSSGAQKKKRLIHIATHNRLVPKHKKSMHFCQRWKFKDAILLLPWTPRSDLPRSDFENYHEPRVITNTRC